MRYSTLGRTDIQVSRVCLGTMTFGSPVGSDEACRLIRHAADAGVTFIDTANMYEGYARVAGSAGGVAEEIVGKAIAGHRSDFVVATKLGMKVGSDPWDEFTSAEAIRIQLDRSLLRLGTDYLDVYYLHRPDPNTAADEIVAALGSEVDAGRIRSWGVSNFDTDQLAELVRVADAQGVPRPAVCQPRINLLDQSALTSLVPYCAREGVSVVPYQVLAGGLLTGKYRRGVPAPTGSRGSEKPEWIPDIDEATQSLLDDFQARADERGIALSQYAMEFLGSRSEVASVLVGATRAAQVDAAITAVG